MNNELPPDVQRQLRELLSRLPNVPVASNFTVRVMKAVELEEMRRSRWHLIGWDWNWRVFIPRATATAVVVGFAVFTFHQYEVSNQRLALAKNVAFVTQSQQMPSVDAL